MKTRKLKKVEAVDKNGKVWSKEAIRELLMSNDNAVYAGMLRIYDRQTSAEQASQQTSIFNSVGFTGCDAEIMSSFTVNYKKFGKLTEKQMVIARKKMVKYWRQLLEVIREQNPNQPEQIEIKEVK